MTAKLWLAMVDDIALQTGLDDVPFSLIQKLERTSKAQVNRLLTRNG